MDNEIIKEQEIKREIAYLCQRFNKSEEQIREAIRRVGKSSENLQQYFQESGQPVQNQYPSFGDLNPSL
ncbi:MAG: DUF3606 domain-containing protein [Agriterribacter sp.]